MKEEQLIRHAYEQVITYAARLAAFSTAKLTKSNGPIGERQEILALDDLASFAYHARRLIALTGTQRMFSNVSIPGKYKEERTVRIKEILNVIVHHVKITIVRTKLIAYIIKYGVEGRDPMEALAKYNHLSKTLIPPIVAIKSERVDSIVFKIENLIEVFQDKILSKIINVCYEHKIYLDLDFNSL